MGPVFVTRAQEETGADPAAIARAYTIAREIFAMRTVWSDIEALDNKVSAAVQYGMFYRAAACCVTPATGCCANAARTCTSRTPCGSCEPGVEAAGRQHRRR